MVVDLTGGAMMTEPRLEVPAELRQLAEKTIDQAERAFGLFFDAARESAATAPASVAEISKQVLAFSEQSLKMSFEHARMLTSTTKLQDAASAQAELVKRQIAGAEQHIRELARASASKGST
jgi:hypothetical protein